MSRLARFISPRSLLWKIVLSTSAAIALLLAAAGWFTQNLASQALSHDLQVQLQGSFRAYESLWQARTEMLRSVSRALSIMSDVRRAFQTNDRATIQDTAQEIWTQVSGTESGGLFLVTDPAGSVIASLGGFLPKGSTASIVRDAAKHFPQQSAGFAFDGGQLYEVVVTPVYVQSQVGSGLLNVLVAGFPVNQHVANEFRERTGGSDFVFFANGRALASTLPEAEASSLFRQYPEGTGIQRVSVGSRQFVVLGNTLRDLAGAPAGELLIVNNFDAITHDLNTLEAKLFATWAVALLAGILISIFIAKQILRPIRQLDDAAALIAEQKYGALVPESGNDELSRLARSFNAMSASIQKAREELIRQERISTITRLSSSIVHDLRNPLASIYGGAEMMMDGDLNSDQLQRLAGNIYRSSRVIKDILQELVDVSRGRIHPPEICRLAEVVGAAAEAQDAAATQQKVTIDCRIDPAIELPLERARIERVFVNLISNAIEAMRKGGQIVISAEITPGTVTVHVDDDGPGIPDAVRSRLFQPFVTSGRNGLGLGLALSRQTVLDHGGDLWLEDTLQPGAHFRLRLTL